MANVVVTGASRGLGLELVKQLIAFPNVSVVFALCRDPPNAKALKDVAEKNPKVKIIKADMVDFSKFDEVADEIAKCVKDGGINLLLNNAGILLRDNIETVTVKNLKDSYELNAVAPVMFTKAMLPLLKKADAKMSLVKSGKSAVVNMSALLGSIEKVSDTSFIPTISYRMSKVALNMATQCLALDLEPLDIFVLAVHPGWVQTDMGGSQAPVTIESSIKAVLKNVVEADSRHRGCMLDDDLEIIPW